MADEGIGRFWRWFEHEGFAHAQVLASFDSVPPGRRGGEEFRKAVALFGHIVAARRVWLARLGMIPASPSPMAAADTDLGRVAEDWLEVQRLWRALLADLDDAALGRSLDYASLDAGRFRTRLDDILAQLFGHSCDHRGQIAALIRASGGEPAATDLIDWCREPIEVGDAGS